MSRTSRFRATGLLAAASFVACDKGPAGTSLLVEFVVDEAGVTQVLGSGGQQMMARVRPKR